MDKTITSDEKENISATDSIDTPTINVTKIPDTKDGLSLRKRIKYKFTEYKKNRIERKKEDEQDYNKLNIKSRAKFVLVIALLIFVISSVIKIANSGNAEPKGWNAYIDIIASLIESVSGIILGLSIGNMSLDFFSYADYMRDRIEEVVVKKEFLKTISDDEKRCIIESLESSLYFNDQPIDTDSLYYNIKDKIVPLNKYYEKSFTHIDCKVEGDKIYKTLYSTLVLKTEEDELRYKLPFAICFNKNDIIHTEKTYNITEVKVNGEPIEILEKYLICDDSPVEQDKKIYYFEYPLTLKKGTNTIYYVSKSVVNISDNTYSKTIAVPCKNCVVEMYLQNDDYKLLGQGFAIDKEKTVDVQYFDNACRIEFKDWIIPGDGCIFCYKSTKIVQKLCELFLNFFGNYIEICGILYIEMEE